MRLDKWRERRARNRGERKEGGGEGSQSGAVRPNDRHESPTQLKYHIFPG